jgi:signal transduction histidine kinase
VIGPKRKLYSYIAVTVLYGALMIWWTVFFSHQDEILLNRMASLGAPLSNEQAEALSTATRHSTRMFAYEGAFLGLLLLASMGLVVRALHRELALQSAQKNLLSAVTHELKSPIASARLYLESLIRGRVEPEKRERYLVRAHEDLERLHRLVDEMLETARLRSTGPKLELEECDLATLVRASVERVRQDPTLAKLDLRLSADETLTVRADPRAMETVLRNLLSNASKYGGERGRVDVAVARAGREARVMVRDHGPGLGDQDPRGLFEPFVRGGEQLVRDRPGSGLGLFFVAQIMKAHSGSVSAREVPANAGNPADPGGGLEIDLRLPVQSQRVAP